MVVKSLLKLSALAIALCGLIGLADPSIAGHTKKKNSESSSNRKYLPKKQKMNSSPLMECPNEVLVLIFNFLPIPDQIKIRTTCKKWNSLIDKYFSRDQQFIKKFQKSIQNSSPFISLLSQVENVGLSAKQLDFLKKIVQGQKIDQKGFEKILRRGSVREQYSLKNLLGASRLLETKEDDKNLFPYTIPSKDKVRFIKKEWYVYFSKAEDFLTLTETIKTGAITSELDVQNIEKFLKFCRCSIFKDSKGHEISLGFIRRLKELSTNLLNSYCVKGDFEKGLLFLSEDFQGDLDLWEMFASHLSKALLSNAMEWSPKNADVMDRFIRLFPQPDKKRGFHLFFSQLLLKFFSIQQILEENTKEKILKLLKDRYIPHTFPEAYYLARALSEGHDYEAALKNWEHLLHHTSGQGFYPVIVKKYCESLLYTPFEAGAFAQSEKLIKKILPDFQICTEKQYIYQDQQNNFMAVKIKKEAILTLHALLMLYNGGDESEITKIFKKLEYIKPLHLFPAIRHRGFHSLEEKTKKVLRELIVKSFVLITEDIKKQKSKIEEQKKLSPFKGLFLEIFGKKKKILKKYEKMAPFFGLEAQNQKDK